jgi:CRP-like cAMP-binding protein
MGYNRSHECEESLAHSFQKASHLDLWLALHALGPSGVDCAQKTLFRRGEPCRGLYMVDEGSVKLFLSPPVNGIQEFETVGVGAVLGLAETMTGGEYKLTAEAVEGARISHIDRTSLMDRLQQNHQLCLQIVHLLSQDLHSLYHRFLGMLPAVWAPGGLGSDSFH